MVIDSATLVTHLSDVVGAVNVRSGDAIDESDTHDEALSGTAGPTRWPWSVRVRPTRWPPW